MQWLESSEMFLNTLTLAAAKNSPEAWRIYAYFI